MKIEKLLRRAACASTFAICAAFAQDANEPSKPANEAEAAKPVPAKGAAPDIPNYSMDDYRNFFGLCWISSVDETLRYAKQMGYRHVYYKDGMEKHPLSKGMFFVMESPEYSVYRRTIDISKKYPPEVIREWETTCSLISLDKPFPQNMATGWFVPPHHFTATLDLQQEKVIEDITNKIIEKVKKIQMANLDFKFSGFAWDVPQPQGDFWSEHKTKKMDNGSQVTLAYWTGKDASVKHPDVTHEYATYSEGHFEFYRRLFEKARKINPDAKWIVEPYSVYNDWMRYMDSDLMKSKGADVKKYMPDFILEENGTTGFVDDERAFKNGLIDKSRTGSSTPNVWDEPQSRKIAAAAAVNGAWNTWFGRIGGTGNCPRYMYIRDVPARLKIAKLLPVWENLNGTPLSERKYENGVYSSPSAGMSDSAIWAKHPETGEVYFTFINMDGYVPVPQGFEIDEISALSGVFEKLEGMAPNETNKWGKKNPPLMEIKDGKIIPNNPGVINMPYCVKFKKSEE